MMLVGRASASPADMKCRMPQSLSAAVQAPPRGEPKTSKANKRR